MAVQKKIVFDQHKANRVIRFVENLRHTKGTRWAGKPFNLLPWQSEILSDIFGTVDSAGLRQYQTAYIEVPKKNGKSELAAAVALYMLTADNEPGAEVYLCAVDKSQAGIVYGVASAMVNMSSTLRKKCKVVDSVKRIVVPQTGSFLQVLSADVPNKHGINPSCIIFDEIHAQPDRKLWDVMTFGSTDAREQPLIFVITTAGDDPSRTSIGWEMHARAADIMDGVRKDPRFYSVIYGLNEDEDWEDPEDWEAVNPSYGEVLKPETIAATYQEVKGNAALERQFRQLRLNQWVVDSITDWVPLSVWDQNGGAFLSGPMLGRSCYMGVDLSSKLDMSALVLLFPPVEEGERWKVVPYFFVPKERIRERVDKDRFPYDQWEKDGYLLTTPGNVIDQDFIEAKILELRGLYDILEVGYDPWDASQLMINLDRAGLTVVELNSTFKIFSPAMKELEKMLVGQEIHHNNHPILRWNFQNLRVKMDVNGNIRPIRGSDKLKIDGLVALLYATSRAMLRKKGRSIYEDRGVLSL